MEPLVELLAPDAAGVSRLGALLRRYVAEQGWDGDPAHLEEIAALPGEYSPPKGAMLMASAGEVDVGCAVMRPIEAWCGECVEMRRLYVIPEARRQGVARAILDSAEAWASAAGYERLRLVTLPHMTEAIELYRLAGFAFVEPYRPSTADDAIFMDKPLVQP